MSDIQNASSLEMTNKGDKLIDIRDIKINSEASKEERIKDFISQIKNPYLYKCGKIIVKVSFSETTETLENKMENYILSL